MGKARAEVWTVERAKRKNREWVWVVGSMAIAALLLLSAGAWLPHSWTQVMWRSQCATAKTMESDVLRPGATHAEAVEALGPVSYEAPGFSHDDVLDAGVCVWQNTEFGEVRGMFLHGRLVGSLLVFE